LFIGVPPQNDSSYFHPYTNTNLYWLTDAESAPLTFQPDSVTAIPTKHIESVLKIFHFEKENFYHHGDSNIDIYTTAQVPGEGWVWQFFYPGDTQTFPFELVRLSTDTTLAQLTVKVHGMTLDPVMPDHHVQVEINDQIVGDMYFNDRQDIRFRATFPGMLLKNGPNQLRVTSVGGTGASLDQFYMDLFEVDVMQELSGNTHMLEFEMPPQNAVCQFSITDLPTDSVWILETNTRRLVKPLTLEREKRLNISVESAGHSAGYFARIILNGETVTFPGKRGINIAIISPDDGTLMETAAFDTYKSTAEADSLARRIAQLDTGTIVIAAVRDDAASNLNTAAIQALENLGSVEISRLQFRDSWAIIGRKGAPAGTVPEKYVPAGTETAMIQEIIWLQAPNAPYHLTFVDSVFAHRNYAITTPRDWLTPSALWADTSSQLQNGNNGADWIVITHPLFEKSAQRLADHRAAQGWRTKVVFIQDIYDEFSYGQLDPAAIRSFLSYAYTNWQKPAPTAVVLMGDASWDMKKNSSTSIKTNFIPAYGNPVSDHWYVCFDSPNDVLPEMLIGRLPVETAESAAAVVEKIISYQNQTVANWHKKALFITGGFNSWEQSLFISESNRLAETYVQAPPAACRPQLVNKTTDGRIEGELKPEIESAINAGQLWVNFLGHSASRSWDLMFNNPDIDELTNENRLPLVTSMTCHTARFANPEIDCFGEHFVNIPEKGAIAFWGTSGWGYISPDITLLNGAYSAVYTDTVRYLGNVVLQAKLNLWNRFADSVYGISTIQQYALLGDPLCAL
ncbi:hypothetical protein KAH55_10910, partial [bacterium]|nr:hypothetical protein [bacterium]